MLLPSTKTTIVCTEFKEVRRHLMCSPLMPNCKTIVVDCKVQIKTGMWTKLAPTSTISNTNCPQHLNEPSGGIKLANTNLIDRLDKGSRTSIHDGNFRTIELNSNIVEFQSTNGGQ